MYNLCSLALVTKNNSIEYRVEKNYVQNIVTYIVYIIRRSLIQPPFL